MHIFKKKCRNSLNLSIRGVQGVNKINVMLMTVHAHKGLLVQQRAALSDLPAQHRTAQAPIKARMTH
jgi:hypothetical protein